MMFYVYKTIILSGVQCSTLMDLDFFFSWRIFCKEYFKFIIMTIQFVSDLLVISSDAVRISLRGPAGAITWYISTNQGIQFD